jgi:hypothetical protein
VFAFIWLTVPVLYHGEDTWKTYTAGALFASRAPAVASDEASVIYATTSQGHGDILWKSLNGKLLAQVSSPECDRSPVFISKSDILFEREHSGLRHVFQANLANGHEIQLTGGNVIDRIIDVNSTGDEVLLYRTKPSIGQGNVPSVIRLSLSNSTEEHIADGAPAAFLGSDIVVTPSSHESEVWLWTKRSTPSFSKLVDGALGGSLSDRLLVVFDPSSYESGDYNALLVDIISREKVTLPRCHAARLVGDHRVMLLQSYRSDVLVCDLQGRGSKKIESPPGYREFANGGRQGEAYLYVRTDEGTNGQILRFDKEAFEFVKVADVE